MRSNRPSPLILSIPLVLLLGFIVGFIVIMYMRKTHILRWRGWWLVGSILLATLQFCAMWTTDSRGPLMGIVTALLVFIFVLLLSAHERSRRISVGLLFIALAVAWLTNWLGYGVHSSPVFILGIIAVTAAALGIIYVEWRAERNRGWLFWALAAVALIVLEGYLLIDLIYGRTGFLVDYNFVLAPALAFALFLSWSTIKVDVSAAEKRRAGTLARITLGQKFVSPLFMRVAVGSVTACLLLSLIALSSAGFGITPRMNTPLCVNSVCMGEPTPAPAPATEPSAPSAATATAVSQSPGLVQENFDDVSTRRTITWRGAARLLSSRESVFEENGALIAARHIFGYGQEMYVLAFPLTIGPQEIFRLSANPHNLFLLVWLEHGLWGFLAFLGLLGAAIAGLWMALWRPARRVAGDWWPALIISVLLGLLLGRLAEQMTGVARVSDIFLFWSMLGLMLALPVVLANWKADEAAAKAEDAELRSAPPARAKARHRNRRRGRQEDEQGSISFNKITQYGWRSIAPASAFAVAAILALTMFISLDVTALLSSGRAIDGYRHSLEYGLNYNQDVHSELLKIHQAGLDHPYSQNYAGDLTNPIGGESGRLVRFVDPLLEGRFYPTQEQREAEARILLNESLEVLQANLDASPFSINNLLTLPVVQRQLYNLELSRAEQEARDRGLDDAAAERAAREQTAALREEIRAALADNESILRSYPVNLTVIADQYRILGEMEDAARVAQNAVDGFAQLEPHSNTAVHNALYILGISQRELGNSQEAIEAQRDLLFRVPADSQFSPVAARELALIYDGLDDIETAEMWALISNEATRIEGQREADPARYFLHRGTVFAALDAPERAIDELETIFTVAPTAASEHAAMGAAMLQNLLQEQGQAERAACYGQLADDLNRFLAADQAEGAPPPVPACRA